MPTEALAFYLDSPMQAWGVHSRFQRRETEAFPSKSGVLGMVAAALGVDKLDSDEHQRIAELAKLRFTAIRMATEGTPAQRLADFHTIGGGWYPAWQADKKNLTAKYSVPRKAGDGSPFGVVVTQRTYLNDARFIVVLEGDASLLAGIAEAIRNPIWGIWFGRKCCLPASPLLPSLGQDRKEAVRRLLDSLPEKSRTPGAMQEEPPSDESASPNDPGAWFTNDEPLSFRSRQFRSRSQKRATWLPED